MVGNFRTFPVNQSLSGSQSALWAKQTNGRKTMIRDGRKLRRWVDHDEISPSKPTNAPEKLRRNRFGKEDVRGGGFLTKPSHVKTLLTRMMCSSKSWTSEKKISASLHAMSIRRQDIKQLRKLKVTAFDGIALLKSV